VAYDIRSPRRLAWVAKALTEAGYRQQYSVFAADLTEPARARLVARLRKLVDLPKMTCGSTWFRISRAAAGHVKSMAKFLESCLATICKSCRIWG
jgi:hypothetical protein